MKNQPQKVQPTQPTQPIQTKMPTQEEAQAIVKNHESGSFTEKKVTLEKYPSADITVFGYIFQSASMFRSSHEKELRGLCFIDGKRYPGMRKFFNVNEREETQLGTLKHEKIKKIQDKLDGSLIMPVQIGGDVVARSKGSFVSDQAKAAQVIIDASPELKFFILDMFDNDFFPMFELVGPSNRIVLEYPRDELRLIAVRTEDGEFIDVDTFSCPVDVAESFTDTLEGLLSKAEKSKKEGFVIKFCNGEMVKIKTKDYVKRHKLVSTVESNLAILTAILDETIDDIIPQVSEEKGKELKEIEKTVTYYLNTVVQDLAEYKEDFLSLTQKELAMKYKNTEYFGVIMRCYKTGDFTIETLKDAVVGHVRKKVNREQKAQVFFEWTKGGTWKV